MREAAKKVLDKFWQLTDDFNYEVLLNRTEKPFEFDVPHFEDAEINQSYSADNKKWPHIEFIKKLNQKVTVEPDYSYCIANFNKIILASVFYPKLIPSFPRYLFSFLKKREKLKTAILFDGKVGTNYFHFFSDVINKIWLINNVAALKNLPIIIGEGTFNTVYFKYIYNNTALKDYNWHVQREGEYIEVDELYLMRPMPYEKRYFENLNALLKVPDIADRNRRVFLNRSKKTGRYIENFEEIKPILDKYKFEIADTDKTGLDFQINLFSSVRYLISIHGAGNTNIIFSDKELRFLELNPANRIACQYYWLAKTLEKAYYDVIMGGELSSTGKGFYLAPQKLENAIIKMLDYVN